MQLHCSLSKITLFLFTLTYSDCIDCPIPTDDEFKICKDMILGPTSVYRCNKEVDKTDAKTAPNITFDAEEDFRYMLIMVDPDAPFPDHPIMKYWLHWLVADILGKDLREGNPAGKTVIDYTEPSPPKGSEPHRYQFLLVEQSNVKGSYDGTVPKANERGNFDLETFLLANDLICNVVAYYQYTSKA